MLVKEETGRIDSTEALRLIKIEFEKSNNKIMLVKKNLIFQSLTIIYKQLFH